jgi:hypothetical protein
MTEFGLWVVALLGPALAIWLVAKLYVMATTSKIHLRRRLPRASGPRIEVLAQNLRTLQHEFQRIESSDLPAVQVRLKAVTLAYDDVLLDCCRALDVEPPHEPPLDSVERIEVESQLARRGLVW